VSSSRNSITTTLLPLAGKATVAVSICVSHDVTSVLALARMVCQPFLVISERLNRTNRLAVIVPAIRGGLSMCGGRDWTEQGLQVNHLSFDNKNLHAQTDQLLLMVLTAPLPHVQDAP
jgi:hypothetical protein